MQNKIFLVHELRWNEDGVKFYSKVDAIIMQSNLAWYYLQHGNGNDII